MKQIILIALVVLLSGIFLTAYLSTKNPLSNQSIKPPIISAPPAPAAKSELKDIHMLYPLENSPIADLQPTIILKIRQSSPLLLPHQFKKGPFAFYLNPDAISYGIEFQPGKPINLSAYLDDQQVSQIFSFPQFPYINCGDQEEKTCLTSHFSNLPPVIIFIKATSALSPGDHNLTLEIAGKKSHFRIKIDPNHRLPKPQLPVQFDPEYFTTKVNFLLKIQNLFLRDAFAGHDNRDRNKIDAEISKFAELYTPYLAGADRCGIGGNYPPTSFPVPLPTTDNKDVFYELFIPVYKSEFRLHPQRKVAFLFNSSQYDLKLTNFHSFYFPYELEKNGQIGWEKAYYLPIDFMVFSQTNEPLKKLKEKELVDYEEKSPFAFNYLEYLPVDYSGNEYKENMLLFRTINSSGCDG